jgi:hypothetical protein
MRDAMLKARAQLGIANGDSYDDTRMYDRIKVKWKKPLAGKIII